MFENQPAHCYYITWTTSRNYHEMIIATDVPLKQSRMKDFERERKKMQYALKMPKETLDEVISRLKNEDGAYG